ncbi:MAG: hypothetical protein ABI433_18215 [Burkholderiaceae bacterium]
MKPAALLSTLLLVLGSPGASAGESPTRRGVDLFNGGAPLQGTIVGHTNALPPSAARCINCHAIGTAAPSSAASASAASFGPLLTPQSLTGAVARRGGPPSRYDAAAFCRLLRQGVDPAWVVVPRSMPRYALTDADCHALWDHLTESKRP